jgi:hypothetical protein
MFMQPLWVCAEKGRLGSLRLLLGDDGSGATTVPSRPCADVHARSVAGVTPLMVAAGTCGTVHTMSYIHVSWRTPPEMRMILRLRMTDRFRAAAQTVGSWRSWKSSYATEPPRRGRGGSAMASTRATATAARRSTSHEIRSVLACSHVMTVSWSARSPDSSPRIILCRILTRV